jgi:hypothetical protein
MTDEERARRKAIVSDTLALNEARRLGRLGVELAHDHRLVAALYRRYGTGKNMLLQLGFDESSAAEYIDSLKENAMPSHDRRRTTADRRRAARDGGQMGEESPVETVIALLSEMSDEEKAEVIEALGGGDRRRARDQPPPFPGRPNTGGELDPLDKYRQPGETRQHAQDRRRHAYDMMSTSRDARDARDDFDRRFPSAAGIRVL